MSATQLRSPINRLFAEALNQGNLAVVDDVMALGQFAHNEFTGGTNGPEGFKRLIATFRTAFPDLHCTVENEIREGDQVAAHWTMRGTHMGFFLGNPPTGKQVQAHGIIFARSEEGLIVEYWMLNDQFGLLQQLGIIPR